MSSDSAFEEDDFNEISFKSPSCFVPSSCKAEMGDISTPITHVHCEKLQEELTDQASGIETSGGDNMNIAFMQLNETEKTNNENEHLKTNDISEENNNENEHLENNHISEKTNNEHENLENNNISDSNDDNNLEHKKLLQSIILNMDYNLDNNANPCVLSNLEQIKGRVDFSSEISMLNYLQNRVRDLIQELNNRLDQLDERDIKVNSPQETSTSKLVLYEDEAPIVIDSPNNADKVMPMICIYDQNEEIETMHDDNFPQPSDDSSTENQLPNPDGDDGEDDESFMNGYTTRVLQLINEMRTMSPRKQKKLMKKHSSTLNDLELDKIHKFMSIEWKRDSFWRRISSRFTLKRRYERKGSYKKIQKKGGLLCWRRNGSASSSLESNQPIDPGLGMETFGSQVGNPEESLAEIPLN